MRFIICILLSLAAGVLKGQTSLGGFIKYSLSPEGETIFKNSPQWVLEYSCFSQKSVFQTLENGLNGGGAIQQVLPPGFELHGITLHIYADSMHHSIKLNESALDAGPCEGWNLGGFHKKTLLEGGQLQQFTTDVRMQIKAVKSANEYNLQRWGGHFSRPNDIFCIPGPPPQDPELVLIAPCPLRFMNDASSLKWYESADGKNWQFVDTGYEMSPVKYSYKGGVFYNQKRWYKVVADNAVNGQKDFASNVYGPVNFYLGMQIDSIQTRAEKDVQVYFQNSAFLQNNYGPRIWIRPLLSEGNAIVWYRLANAGPSPVSLNNRVWVLENGEQTSLVLNKGMYELRIDFTPWNNFDCKLQYSVFNLENDLKQTEEILLSEQTKTALKFKMKELETARPVLIGGDSVSTIKTKKSRHKNILIQQFTAQPNPNDGQNYTIVVKLSKPAPIRIYKIDPVTGIVLGIQEYAQEKEFYLNTFRTDIEGVFYLKLVAENESSVIKVIAVN